MFDISKYNELTTQLGVTQLLAVTKYQSDETTLRAIQSGVGLIGESRVHDAQIKYTRIQDAELDCKMHMIGHLQTNKVKDAIQIFDTIQSVDSIKLLRKINQEIKSSQHKSYQDILLQLNLTGESQKYGFDQDKLGEMLGLCESLPYIRCDGLMCMGVLGDDAKTREIYAQCRSLCDQYDLPHCSMGMSGDREIAVQEGSTLVRVGSLLFDG